MRHFRRGLCLGRGTISCSLNDATQALFLNLINKKATSLVELTKELKRTSVRQPAAVLANKWRDICSSTFGRFWFISSLPEAV